MVGCIRILGACGYFSILSLPACLERVPCIANVLIFCNLLSTIPSPTFVNLALAPSIVGIYLVVDI